MIFLVYNGIFYQEDEIHGSGESLQQEQLSGEMQCQNRRGLLANQPGWNTYHGQTEVRYVSTSMLNDVPAYTLSINSITHAITVNNDFISATCLRADLPAIQVIYHV